MVVMERQQGAELIPPWPHCGGFVTSSRRAGHLFTQNYHNLAKGGHYLTDIILCFNNAFQKGFVTSELLLGLIKNAFNYGVLQLANRTPQDIFMH